MSLDCLSLQLPFFLSSWRTTFRELPRAGDFRVRASVAAALSVISRRLLARFLPSRPAPDHLLQPDTSQHEAMSAAASPAAAVEEKMPPKSVNNFMDHLSLNGHLFPLLRSDSPWTKRYEAWCWRQCPQRDGIDADIVDLVSDVEDSSEMSAFTAVTQLIDRLWQLLDDKISKPLRQRMQNQTRERGALGVCLCMDVATERWP